MSRLACIQKSTQKVLDKLEGLSTQREELMNDAYRLRRLEETRDSEIGYVDRLYSQPDEAKAWLKEHIRVTVNRVWRTKDDAGQRPRVDIEFI